MWLFKLMYISVKCGIKLILTQIFAIFSNKPLFKVEEKLIKEII